MLSLPISDRASRARHSMCLPGYRLRSHRRRVPKTEPNRRRMQGRTSPSLRCSLRMFFLSFFASPFVSEIFRQAKSPFVSYACHIRDERAKPSAVPLLFIHPGNALRDTDISLLFNGSVPSAPIFRKAFQRSRSTVSSSLNLLDASQLPALL